MFIYLFKNFIGSKLHYIKEHYVNKEYYNHVLLVPNPEPGVFVQVGHPNYTTTGEQQQQKKKNNNNIANNKPSK